MFGLMLGLVLGLGLAFVVEALDTRVRSATEVGERLGMPQLARVPPPPKGLSKDDRLVMLAQPTGTNAEAFRMLRTNLDFATLESRRCPNDPRHERRRAGGEVDDGGQPRGRRGARRAPRRPGRPRSARPLHRPLLRPPARGGHHRRRAGAHLARVGAEADRSRHGHRRLVDAGRPRDATAARSSAAPSTCSCRGRARPTRASSSAAGGWARSSRACTRPTTSSFSTRPLCCASATR